MLCADADGLVYLKVSFDDGDELESRYNYNESILRLSFSNITVCYWFAALMVINRFTHSNSRLISDFLPQRVGTHDPYMLCRSANKLCRR